MAKHKERAAQFVEWAKQETGLDGETVDTIEEATRAGDIVSIAASPEIPLFFKDEWVRPGATVILTSPITADDDFWLKNVMIFDNARMHEAYYTQAESFGNVTQSANGWGLMYKLIQQRRLPALQESISLGDVVVNPSQGRRDKKTKIMFVTSGQVLFDVAWGYEIFHEAKKKNIGQKLSLWDEPYWK
jgi:ornithine cyclodeaminase